MTLAAGSKLGPYEIVSPLGAGGMGEVYRAKDSRLGRVVAIKVLPEAMARDPVALARFEREAKAVAALSHPGILALHDIGTEDGVSFAVMELLEGETLRVRLIDGPLPPRKLADFARQIAEGLAAAHERGIVHRDLKPENLWVTPDGRIKILDFGLAKVREESSPAQTDHHTPTQSVATAPGIVMGTAGYMSPEQVRGEALDHRSDIFSFGAVLYEMATGQRAFRGDSAVETMNAILKEEPPEPNLGAPIAPSLERIIRHCLEKKPGERFQSARDLAFDLSSLSGTSATAAPMTTRDARRKTVRLALILGFVALLSALAGMLLMRRARRAEPVPALSAMVPLPAAAEFRNVAVPELSPDGATLLFSGIEPDESQPLWLRPLDADEARPLPGTEGASFAFWSPDGRSIGFFAGRKLKRIDLAGGAPVTVCDIPERSPRGGSWSRDGVIVFAGARIGGLSRVSAGGGVPEPVTRLDEKRGDTTHRWPHFLPDGKHFIYYGSPNTAPGQQALFFASLDGRESRILLPRISNAVFAAGRLLYISSDKLFAHRFDPEKGILSGEPELLAEDVGAGYGISRALFTASRSGRLAYVPKSGNPLRTMEWIDRSGNSTGRLGETLFYYKARITADGAHVIVSIGNPLQKQADLWEYEISGGGRRRLSFSPGEHWTPVYSPDGGRLYSINRDGGVNSVIESPLNGGQETKTAIDLMQAESLLDASPDGRWLALSVWNPKGGTNYDIFLLATGNERTLRPYLNGPEDESAGRFSPAGGWFAYESEESGRAEIYVQSYPEPGRKWQVSAAGGSVPLWRRDGRELYFIGADQRLMAVAVDPGKSFHAGAPAPLFAGTLPRDRASLDVTPDGQRFLLVTAAPAPIAVRLVLGWPERLGHGKGPSE